LCFKSEKTGLVTYFVVRSRPQPTSASVLTESRNVLDDYKNIYE